MDVFKAIWHHMAIEEDGFPHVFGGPTDCYCEPEVADLGKGHRLVTHQDMTGKTREVQSNG